MEEWHLDFAGATYSFKSLADAMNWLAAQAEGPALLHRVTRRHYGTYGVAGGHPWPAPPTPAPTWATAAESYARVTRA